MKRTPITCFTILTVWVGTAFGQQVPDPEKQRDAFRQVVEAHLLKICADENMSTKEGKARDEMVGFWTEPIDVLSADLLSNGQDWYLESLDMFSKLLSTCKPPGEKFSREFREWFGAYMATKMVTPEQRASRQEKIHTFYGVLQSVLREQLAGKTLIDKYGKEVNQESRSDVVDKVNEKVEEICGAGQQRMTAMCSNIFYWRSGNEQVKVQEIGELVSQALDQDSFSVRDTSFVGLRILESAVSRLLTSDEAEKKQAKDMLVSARSMINRALFRPPIRRAYNP